MRRLLLFVLAIVAAVVAAGPAAAAIQVSINSPANGAHSLSGVVPVKITASADAGVFGVQLYIDNAPYGPIDTTQLPNFQYEIPWDTSTYTRGDHTLKAVAVDWSVPNGGGAQQPSDTVTVDVGPAYPTISITAPSAFSFARGTIPITVSSTSAVTPATIAYAVDGTALASPSWNTTAVADGTHTVSAKITDGRGKTATASSQVTVDNHGPAVSISSPPTGGFFTGSLPAKANASDAYGVSKVQFRIDGTLVGSPVTTPDSGAPFTYSATLSLGSLASGVHQLSAVATDAAGNNSTAAAIAFTIGYAPPTIAMSVPPDWTFGRGNVSVGAAVTGGAPTVSVQFLLDGNALGSPTTTSPYAITWNTVGVAAGPHILGARVTDGQGRTASATGVHVTVDNVNPTVQVTSPAAGSYFQGSLPAKAHASDANGIKSVQFLVDGTAKGPLLTAPDASGGFDYSTTLDLSGLTAGTTHQLTATTIDQAGNSTTSAAIAFAVAAGPPTVSITQPPDWSFADNDVTIAASVSGGVAPLSAQLLIDGVASGAPLTAAPYTWHWNTTSVANGSHTVAVKVTDAVGGTATATAHLTIDHTNPTVQVTSPAAGNYFQASIPVKAHASDGNGIKSVQFFVDGTAKGPLLTSPDVAGGFDYSATLDLSGVASGTHQVTATATDLAGNTATSAAVNFFIASGPPAVTITSPPDWNFANKTTSIVANVTGGVAPVSAQLIVDGVNSGAPITAAPYTFAWDTTTLVDGTHTVAVKITDATNATATSATLHETVDNTLPSEVMYQPTANARTNGPTTFQVHASDAYGVKSVQFTADGTPVGALLTQPDAGQQYLYTITFDTSTLPAGTHAISANVTDSAGNVGAAAPVSIKTGPIDYMPVLNYHEIDNPDGNSIYDQTLAQADAELAYLKNNGYTAVTLEQYQQWLSGTNIGVAKPVLITVDDGLNDQRAWDTLFQKYGMKGVLYVITGFADNNTPGDSDPNNMTWTTIKGLAANGRWQVAFHAGQYGHGDSYGDGVKITLSTTNTSTTTTTQTLGLPATCPYFYTCLGTVTTTVTNRQTRRVISTSNAAETVSAYKTRVTNEVNAGMTRLKQQVPSAVMLAWAAPFNDAGQWTNLYNDSSGQVQAWFPGFMASKFPIVHTQTNPVTYGQASGTVGSLSAFGRRYRFEVHTDTTIPQFAAALTDPAFAR